MFLLTQKPTARSPNRRAKRCTRRRRCTNRSPARNSSSALIGENVQAAANSIAACPATKYFGVTGAEFSQSRYATDAAAAEAICKAAQATVVVAPATSRWARVLAGVAQRLGGRADTHVTGVAAADGKISVNRWYYRQRMEGALTRTQRPWFIGIDPGSQTPCECGAGTAAVEMVPVNLTDASQTHHGGWHSRAEGRRANHSARRAIAVCHRRGLDKETGRRPDACAGGGKIDSRFPESNRARRSAAANRWWIWAARARPCCRSCRT